MAQGLKHDGQTTALPAGKVKSESNVLGVHAFPDEADHLADIQVKLENALREADNSIGRLDREYSDFKLYMVQNRSEIDPHEMFQNERVLNRIDHSGAFAVNIREKIAKMKDSPYFARIDFVCRDKQDEKAYYIGRFGFTCENQIQIVDWRAPIAGMFYDCEIGPAGYPAPSGRVEGRLTRKRQFQIRQGKMEYALESAVNIQDDILQRELSQTSDEKMKSIISTIQAEQNRIIRNENAKTMLIQGVAGSGKTSIALHRVAYLLYRYPEKLSAKYVAILSPNKVFGDYISNVLPELGEEPIKEMSVAELASVLLKGTVSFETEKYSIENDDLERAERTRFKSTREFLDRMDRFIRQMPERVFQAEDFSFGWHMVQADWIQARFCAYRDYPVKQRLQFIAEDIGERLAVDHPMEDDLPKKKAILKQLCGMLRVKNGLALYQEFYRKENVPGLLHMPNRNTLEWEDVYPYLYLCAAYEGLHCNTTVQHLVIDEMQDYTPVQFAVINRLFPCSKTILGDFGQTIHRDHLHSLTDLKSLYPDAEMVTLNKSYRSTYEIIHFAKQIRSISELEAIERHGEEPALIFCSDGEEEIRYLRERIRAFQDGRNGSLGILTKTNRLSNVLYEILEQDCCVHCITPDSTKFEIGVSIVSIPMAKGLEFDEVILPSADDRTYFSEQDRNLLYIACTRAMHRLTLTYTGTRTTLIRLSGAQ